MGCCCSEKLESFDGDPSKITSTKSLRSEIDNEKYKVPKLPQKMQRFNAKRLTENYLNTWALSPQDSYRRKTQSSRSTSASCASAQETNSSGKNEALPTKFLTTSIRENFTTIRKIYQGFFGEISLVTENKTGLKRVIKEIKKLAVPMEAQEKIIQEIQKYKCLDHPNVIKLHEVYESKLSWFLVYEYLRGGSLLKQINEEGIGYSTACSVIRDILNGLNYCHKKRIYHLGLNLEKVLMNSWDEKISKILGFALPWEVEDRVKINEVNCFMAPEVLDGNYNQAASDIWSAGIILYAIIQGKPPFRGKNLIDLKMEYEKGIDFEGDSWIFIPSELKNLLSGMLEYDYKRRIKLIDALNHPWITNNQHLITTPENEEKLMENLLKFASKNKIVREFFIKATHEDRSDNRQIVDFYKSLDADKDEEIGYEEILSEVKNVSIKLQNKFKEALNSSDFFEKGYIGYSEFVAACTDWSIEENIAKLEKVFIDCQRSGIEQLSLKKLKARFGGIRRKDWSKFFEAVNTDQSGTISFLKLKEFCLN